MADAGEFTLAFGLERARRAEEELIANAKRLVGSRNAELVDAIFEVGFRYGQAEMAEALEHDLGQIFKGDS
jgi:hypothetical protein